MTRRGKITVTGSQRDEADGELTTVVTAQAEYYTRDRAHYILYDEILKDTDSVVKNCIKLKDGLLELTRKGAISTRMVFQPGQEHMTLYSTPCGALPLGILTETLESDFRENMLQIRAAYTLTSQGMSLSKNKIHIKMIFQD